MKKNKLRNSKFELLRIISMCLIISSHYSLYTKWGGDKSSIAFQIKTMFFQPFGQIGVDLFVMISGYFLLSRKINAASSIIRSSKLYLNTYLYSWLILLSSFCFNKINMIKNFLLTKGSMLHAIFLFLTNEYWFIDSYIVLMLFVPMINLFFADESQHTLLMYIYFLLVVSGVITLLPTGFTPFGRVLNVGIMITCYLWGGYVHKYNPVIKLYLLALLLFIGLFVEYAGVAINRLTLTNGFAPFFVAIVIFYVFDHIKDFHNKTINWIASSVIASYLILASPIMDYNLWSSILHVTRFKSEPILPGVIISILLVAVTVLIDKLYGRLEKRLISSRMFKLFDDKVRQFLK